MDKNIILSKVDHTLLSPVATWGEIKEVCDDGIKYKVASICIPPSYVKRVKEYVEGKIAICTVVGFPNGYNTKAVKVFETKEAIQQGADEIDMVINIGQMKDQDYQEIIEEIKAVKEACGEKILKVIIETAILTDEEIEKACELVEEGGGDYIKTSTGFSTRGANLNDIEIFARNLKKDTKIKAAGGISSFDDARGFINAGALRLGTSRLVKLMK